jgi:hypothetical protein
MIRSLICSLLFLFVLPGSSLATPADASSGPIQGTPGQPVQVGPWQVMVQRVQLSHEEDTPVLEVRVSLRNTSATAQSLAGGIFTCYRADVWQGLASVETDASLPAVVEAKHTAKATLGYQLPPDVLSFGLVFFWQASGGSATGIWSLQLPA